MILKSHYWRNLMIPRRRWMLELLTFLVLMTLYWTPVQAEREACPTNVLNVCDRSEATITYYSYSECKEGFCGIFPDYDDRCDVDCIIYRWEGQECSLGWDYSCQICSRSCTENACCL